MANYKMIPTLGFTEAVEKASKRLLDFNGRSRRSEFWWWMLIVLILNIVMSQLLKANVWANMLTSTAVMFLGLSVTARRLQDTGKSAWFVYVSYGLGILTTLYIPYSGYNEILQEVAQKSSSAGEKLLEQYMDVFAVVGTLTTLWMISCLVVVIFCCMDGTKEPNKYGKSPKYIMEESVAGDFEEVM